MRRGFGGTEGLWGSNELVVLGCTEHCMEFSCFIYAFH
jgi:hypothetical protein